MSDDSEIINPPDTLSKKVDKGGPGAVDMAALARAEDVIANLADDYVDWAKADLVRLEEAYEALKTADGDDAEKLEEVFQISHDMKGQGGSFGFDLMTAVGDRLCRLVEKMKKAGPREIEMIRVYIDTMKVIINTPLKGDGGKEGHALITGLTLMIEKIK